VIPKGTITSRPASSHLRIDFIMELLSSPGRRCASSYRLSSSRGRRRRAGSGCAGGRWRGCGCSSWCAGRISGFRIALDRRLGLGAHARIGTIAGLARLATAKISHIPARAFELKAGSRYLFGKRLLPARRAGSQQGIGEFLQHVFGMAARRASVSINGHGARQVKGVKSAGALATRQATRCQGAKPSIIVCPSSVRA
jgi:hypothetical protein